MAVHYLLLWHLCWSAWCSCQTSIWESSCARAFWRQSMQFWSSVIWCCKAIGLLARPAGLSRMCRFCYAKVIRDWQMSHVIISSRHADLLFLKTQARSCEFNSFHYLYTSRQHAITKGIWQHLWTLPSDTSPKIINLSTSWYTHRQQQIIGAPGTAWLSQDCLLWGQRQIPILHTCRSISISIRLLEAINCLQDVFPAT